MNVNPKHQPKVKSQTVLLLVDVINDLDFPGNEQLLKEIKSIGPRIASLKQRAKIAGVQVIYANDNFGQWQSSFEKIVKHCTTSNTPGQKLSRLLAPEEDDLFVLKPKFSAFYCTPLKMLLEHLQAERLILAGVAGNICIYVTSADAYMRNYKICVPSDCVASNTNEENRFALEQMRLLHKAEILESADIIF